MLLKVEALKQFLESTDYPVLISVSDCEAWCLEGDRYVKWVSWSNSENGSYLEGYSCYLPEGYERQDGYFIANLDTQTGCWQTELFEESKELSTEDFEEKYGEHM
jgi:hypothetical protein|tara:strand:- start:582 stop:896 length:315 start_codon:yes stop_codon:yes gene_type:complete